VFGVWYQQFIKTLFSCKLLPGLDVFAQLWQRTCSETPPKLTLLYLLCACRCRYALSKEEHIGNQGIYLGETAHLLVAATGSKVVLLLGVCLCLYVVQPSCLLIG
jgi:hypothetical protein